MRERKKIKQRFVSSVQCIHMRIHNFSSMITTIFQKRRHEITKRNHINILVFVPRTKRAKLNSRTHSHTHTHTRAHKKNGQNAYQRFLLLLIDRSQYFPTHDRRSIILDVVNNLRIDRVCGENTVSIKQNNWVLKKARKSKKIEKAPLAQNKPMISPGPFIGPVEIRGKKNKKKYLFSPSCLLGG